MSFANPWGLLGLFSIPVILFIHLYQRRFPSLEIAGLHLWSDEQQTKTAGRRLDRLPITRSLLLELVAAILLTALFARPQIINTGTATHWIFVLDNSASMSALRDDGTSFRDLTLQEIESRADKNSRVSVILTGTRPTLFIGPAASLSEARSKLKAWQPQGTHHGFQSAWDMATQLAEQSGEALFLTDDIRGTEGLPPRMEAISVGQSLTNIAFETARWSLDEQSLDESLYLRLRNYSARSSSAEVICKAGDAEVFRKAIDLDPDSSAPLAIELPGGLKTLSLQIQSPDDHLPTDSYIQLIEPRARTVDIAISLPEKHPGLDQIRRVLRSLNVVNIVNAEDADLVVSPANTLSNSPRDRWHLTIGPLDGSEAALRESSTTTGPFLIERRNPLVEGISLQGIIWSGIQKAEFDLSPIISAGSTVLLGQRSDLDFRSYFLNIDLSQSNLGDSPDWPILISNMVENCRDSRPGLRRWNYHLNEIVQFELDSNRSDPQVGRALTLTSAAGSRNLVRSATVEVPLLNAIGIYEIADGQESLDRFSVNFFDRDESDLNRLTGGQVDRQNESTRAMVLSERVSWIWMLLIGLTIIVALANWAVLKPRQAEAVTP